MIVYYPDMVARSCLRTLSWRWRRAIDLVHAGRRFCPRQDDALTGRAVDYLLDYRQSFDDPFGREIEPDPVVVAAFRLYSGDDPRGPAVEARILARVPFPEIAWQTGVDLATLELFEALFFQCLDRLDARDWVRHHCLRSPHVRPRTIVLRRFAYYGGPFILAAVEPYLLDDRPLWDPPLDLATAAGRREQRVRLCVALQLLPVDPKTDKLLMRLHLLVVQRDRRRRPGVDPGPDWALSIPAVTQGSRSANAEGTEAAVLAEVERLLRKAA